MKRTFMRARVLRLIAAVQCVLMLTGVTTAALAASEARKVDFSRYGDPIWTQLDNDGNKLLVYSPDKSKSVYDLFGLATKELEPGMTVDGIIINLTNKSSETYNFYLKATPRTAGKENHDSKEMEEYFPEKKAVDSLLEQVDITVSSISGSAGSEVPIYNGKLIGRSDAPMYSAEHGVLLGSLGAGQFRTIKVTITIPSILGNDYMNALATVDWEFNAGQPDPQIIPSDDPGDFPNNPDITITPTESPLVDISPSPSPSPDDTSTIDDDKTPVTEPDIVVVVDPGDTLPQTGGIKTYVFPALFALALFLVLFFLTRNKKGGKANN